MGFKGVNTIFSLKAYPNPTPQKHKRLKPEIISGLQHLADDDPEAIIIYHIQQAGYSVVSFSHLKIMSNLTDKQLDTILQHLLSQRTILQTDKENRIYIHQTTFDQLKQKSAEYLANYHETNPLKAGMPKEELRSKFPLLSNSKLFNLVLNVTGPLVLGWRLFGVIADDHMVDSIVIHRFHRNP